MHNVWQNMNRKYRHGIQNDNNNIFRIYEHIQAVNWVRELGERDRGNDAVCIGQMPNIFEFNIQGNGIISIYPHTIVEKEKYIIIGCVYIFAFSIFDMFRLVYIVGMMFAFDGGRHFLA